MKKIVFVLVPVLVVAAVAFFVFRGKEKASEAKYVTAELKKGDISIVVTATGTLEAVTTVQVGSQISGTISALYANFNDTVKKGQVIALLDPTFLKAQVAQTQADLEKARVSAELSRREYERSLSLFDEKMISESERDIALTNYELAKAQETSAQASLDRVKTNLDYATIRSPIDGVVVSRDVDVGQTVAASLQAPTLFTIAEDLTRMQVKASIDEADIGKIKEGLGVRFTVDAYPEQNFDGKVSQVRLSPQIVQNVVSYDVIIEVSNPNLLLKPGMTANVTVLVDRKEGVLEAPAAAFRFRPSPPAGKGSERGEGRGMPPGMGGGTGSGGQMSRPASFSQGPRGGGDSGPGRFKGAGPSVLWVLGPDGQPRPVPARSGISDGTFTEVISDSLNVGDQVVVGQKGVAMSANGQQVNPFAPRFGERRR